MYSQSYFEQWRKPGVVETNNSGDKTFFDPVITGYVFWSKWLIQKFLSKQVFLRQLD